MNIDESTSTYELPVLSHQELTEEITIRHLVGSPCQDNILCTIINEAIQLAFLCASCGWVNAHLIMCFGVFGKNCSAV